MAGRTDEAEGHQQASADLLELYSFALSNWVLAPLDEATLDQDEDD